MSPIRAISLTSQAYQWLEDSCEPRVLHIFDRACNLVNERREILSIVTPQIGNGPFNLVIEDDLLIFNHVEIQSALFTSASSLRLGDVIIDTTNAQLWSPRPDWELLHVQRSDLVRNLTKIPITNYLKYSGFDILSEDRPGMLTHHEFSITQSPVSDLQLSTLSCALAKADISSARRTTSELAGLGIGLTPAGDDFLLGAMLAAWIIYPREIAAVLTREITNTAAPLTTSLSAAYLRSAGRGEAGVLWHRFLDALVAGHEAGMQRQVTELLSMGHTSGADALAGFMRTMMCWAELPDSQFPGFSS